MTSSASPALLVLILIVMIVIAIGQFAFFFWAIRNRNRINQPTTPAQYNFMAKIIAGCFFAVAAVLAVYSTFVVATGMRTTGAVIELKENRDKEKDHSSFAPIFAFVDSAGNTNVVTSSLYSSSNRYRVGDRVPVIYRKSNPSAARINGFAENWFAPIGFSGAALIILVSMPIYRKWRELGAKSTKQESDT